jgi:hypothetical protein
MSTSLPSLPPVQVFSYLVSDSSPQPEVPLEPQEETQDDSGVAAERLRSWALDFLRNKDPPIIHQPVERFTTPYDSSPIGGACLQFLEGLRGFYIFVIHRLVYLLNQPYWKDYISRFSKTHPACQYFSGKCDIVNFLRFREDGLAQAPNPIDMSISHYINTDDQSQNPLLTEYEAEFLEQARVLFATHESPEGCTSDLAYAIRALLDLRLPDPFTFPGLFTSERTDAFGVFHFADTVERFCCRPGEPYGGPAPYSTCEEAEHGPPRTPFSSPSRTPPPQNPEPEETFPRYSVTSGESIAFDTILQARRYTLLFAIRRLVYLLNKPYWKTRIEDLPHESRVYQYFTQECDIEHFLRPRDGNGLAPPSSPVSLFAHIVINLQKKAHNPLLRSKEAVFLLFVRELFLAQPNPSFALLELTHLADVAAIGIQYSYDRSLSEIMEINPRFDEFFRHLTKIEQEYV